MEERELIERLLAGEGEAAELFVARYRFVVMRALRRFRVLSPADVEDLFQELFARLFEDDCSRLVGWEGRSGLAGYVRRIATNLAIDHLRARRSEPEAEPLDDPDALVGDAADPETTALINELRRMMLEAVQQLAPPRADVIRLVDLEGCTYAAAAERLGITANNLGVRLHAARTALARIIAQRYPALMSYVRDST